MNIPVKTSSGGYDIVLERGAIERAGELLRLNRRVLIVTDDGVPEQYVKAVAAGCYEPVIHTFFKGERSKQPETLFEILRVLADNAFTRSDCIVAVGGGVVGDLAGFAASIYMRGIEFYNVPTTLLSQVDSSIGGKTAIDFAGYKNLVGSFYPPSRVIIDPDTLKTLPARQVSNGLAEALKMSLTSDPELFSIFENRDVFEDAMLDRIIYRSLLIKRHVVEEDEREGGLRRILNFGHTLAHAIESANSMDRYYHGECVALGMIPMCSEDIRERLIPILNRLSLPTVIDEDPEVLIEAARHDKKTAGDDITVVTVSEIGSCEMKKLSFSQYEDMIRQVL